MSFRLVTLLSLLSVLLLLGGCGELQDWRTTQRADTLESYQSFIERYPQSQYVPVAQRRLTDLEEQRDWLIASESDTAESYRNFINAHPKGRWTREARVRLQNYMSTPGVIGPAAIEPAESPPPPAMLPEEIAPPAEPMEQVTTPDPPAAVAVEPAPVTHRIQLGAFSSRDKALEAWRTARSVHSELQGLVSQVIIGSNGKVDIFRLQASVVSETRAREICRELVAAGQGCVYIPPGR